MSDPIRSISQNNFLLAAQQEVSHDNTLSGNGTEESPLGLNETVLWSNASGAAAGDFPLTESVKNFEKVRITHGCSWAPSNRMFAADSTFETSLFDTYWGASIISTEMERGNFQSSETVTHFSITPITLTNNSTINVGSSRVTFLFTPTSQGSITGNHKMEDAILVYKIVGINRIANN